MFYFLTHHLEPLHMFWDLPKWQFCWNPPANCNFRGSPVTPKLGLQRDVHLDASASNLGSFLVYVVFMRGVQVNCIDSTNAQRSDRWHDRNVSSKELKLQIVVQPTRLQPKGDGDNSRVGRNDWGGLGPSCPRWAVA